MDRYRLGPVRDVRRISERASAGALAEARGEARASAERLVVAEERVATLDVALSLARAEPPSAPAFVLVRGERYRARLRRAREAALVELAQVAAQHAGREAEVDEARERLVRARADREVIERHFASWRDAQRKRAERRAD